MRFKLLRYFSVASAFAIIIITAALTFLYVQNAERQLIETVERQNVVLASTMANVIAERFPDHLSVLHSPSSLGQKSHRHHVVEIDRVLRTISEGLPILAINIFSDGLTIYSSQKEQIGTKSSAGFLLTGTGQKPASKLLYRDKFNAFKGGVSDRNIVETYVPVPPAQLGGYSESRIVFEIYTDVSPLIASIAKDRIRLLLILVGFLGLLYVVLFLIVRRADRILDRQYADSKQAEAALSAAKEHAELANRAKTDFLANVSHELRTPLNAILGFSEILSHQYFGPTGTEKKYREYATDIHSSAEHLLTLVNDLLDISVVEAGETLLDKEEFSIKELIADCTHTVGENANSKGIDLTTMVPEDLPSIFADRRAIKQILLNLLSNAVKFTPAGGKITVLANASDSNTEIVVADTGQGIPPEHLPHITKPFNRSERNTHKTDTGWGLGLAISKSLIDLHDGEIDVDSKLGKGTTVTVSLPNGVQQSIAMQT